MKRYYGALKDAFDPRDHLAMRSGNPLPASVSLLPFLSAVRNQGQAGSCTGNAGAGWRDFLAKKFLRIDLFSSALCLYGLERIKDGTFPRDEGSTSRTLMQVLNQIGVCTDAQDPYSDTAIAQRPTPEQVQEAGANKIGAYHRIVTDEGMVTAKSVLSSGYAFVTGIPVFEEIESDEVAETGLLPVPGQDDSAVGGHELLVFGYDDSIKIGSSQGAFQVRNSWGEDWGLRGNLWIPYGYYAAVGGDDACDMWVGHFGKPWIPKTGVKAS